MTPQQFVDSLNMRLMPELGYVWRGKWVWPTYDWSNHDHSDFSKANRAKSHVQIQAERLAK